jgi:hypothetical protein
LNDVRFSLFPSDRPRHLPCTHSTSCIPDELVSCCKVPTVFHACNLGLFYLVKTKSRNPTWTSSTIDGPVVCHPRTRPPRSRPVLVLIDLEPLLESQNIHPTQGSTPSSLFQTSPLSISPTNSTPLPYIIGRLTISIPPSKTTKSSSQVIPSSKTHPAQPAPKVVQQSKEQHVHSEMLVDLNGECNVAHAPECAEEQREPYDGEHA